MLSDSRWVFLVISTVMIVAITVYMIKWRPKSKLFYVAAAFVVGGGIGNMIDRVCLGYVIDFIDFCAFPEIWNWVFNIADSFVCIGAGMFMLWVILSTIEEAKEEKQKSEASENATIEADVTEEKAAELQNVEVTLEKSTESEESESEQG